jgi:hypothetical protein
VTGVQTCALPICHKRPEMKKGLPITEANVKAADLMKKIKELTP